MLRVTLAMILIAAVAGPSDLGAQKKIGDRVRTNASEPIVTGVLRDIPFSTIEELTAGAEWTVEARLSGARSHVAAAQYDVQTDYRIFPDRVIKGSILVKDVRPSLPTHPILTVYGGQITIDGVKVLSIDHNMNDERHEGYYLKEGCRYLLFLRRFPGRPDRYQLYNGGAFEITDQTVKPLLKGYAEKFKETVEQPYEQIVKRVQQAARNR